MMKVSTMVYAFSRNAGDGNWGIAWDTHDRQGLSDIERVQILVTCPISTQPAECFETDADLQLINPKLYTRITN